MSICDKDHGQMAGRIQDLPSSQKNDVRHVCAACAYEAGFHEGAALVRRRVRNLLGDGFDHAEVEEELAFIAKRGDTP